MYNKDARYIVQESANRSLWRVNNLIKVVLIDIDNTLLSFTGYVKESMREGFSYFGLKPYTEDMFSIFEKINNSLWRQLEQGTLTFEELEKCRWNMIFKELGIVFDGPTFEEFSGRDYITVPYPRMELRTC